MTSNIGTDALTNQAVIGFQARTSNEKEAADTEFKQAKERVLDQLKHNFKPEFLNRVDEIVVFKPLTKEELTTIVGLQLQLVKKRLAERGVTINWDKKSVDYLIQFGYDPVYGARPLKRLIQSKILDNLALAIIQNELTEGSAVTITAKKAGLDFHYTKSASIPQTQTTEAGDGEQ